MSWNQRPPPSSNRPRPWASLLEPGFEAVKVRGSHAGFTRTVRDEKERLKGPAPLSIPMTSISVGSVHRLEGTEKLPAVKTISLSPDLYSPRFPINLCFFPTQGVSNKFIKISQCST